MLSRQTIYFKRKYFIASRIQFIHTHTVTGAYCGLEYLNVIRISHVPAEQRRNRCFYRLVRVAMHWVLFTTLVEPKIYEIPFRPSLNGAESVIVHSHVRCAENARQTRKIGALRVIWNDNVNTFLFLTMPCCACTMLDTRYKRDRSSLMMSEMDVFSTVHRDATISRASMSE